MIWWSEVERGKEPDLDPDMSARLLNASPFVHWFASNNADGVDVLDTGLRLSNSVSITSFLRSGAEISFRAPGGGVGVAAETFQPQEVSPPVMGGALQRQAGATAQDILALPDHAERPDALTGSWLPDDLAVRVTGQDPDSDPEKLRAAMQADLPRDTVIVGIVDDGIAWGHDRFRLPDSDDGLDTRFLAAWIQGGVFRAGGGADRAPFGRDMFRNDLRDLMRAHSAGRWLDEDAFYRAVDPAPARQTGRSEGARALAGAAGHGTHVLDLACGADPERGDPAELRRQRIIAVNLPSRRSIGMAGTFLEFYVAYAMRRIVAMADRLWSDIHGDGPGFPVVLNVSYGQQSGTKTGTSLIEKEYHTLLKSRTGKAPIELVMPVGNDNLTRANARWRLRPPDGALRSLSIGWRVLPEDQSSNFVEIWADLLPEEYDGAVRHADGRMPLLVSLLPPGSVEPDWIAGKDRHHYALNDDTGAEIARIYTTIEPIPDLSPDGQTQTADTQAKPKYRIRYVLSLHPSLNHARPDQVSPAGRWMITVAWDDGETALSGLGLGATGEAAAFLGGDDGKTEPRNVYINVQVDQDPGLSSNVNHRSFFDEPNYRTHAPNGRPLDSFAFLPGEVGLAGRREDLTPTDIFGAVQRKGSQNALAIHPSIHAIAGHRWMDGRPADFSATYTAKDQLSTTAEETISEAPTASFPVDDGAVLIGVAAAGVAPGSVQRLRGTSFAAPQATRWIVSQLRDRLTGRQESGDAGSAAALKEAARKTDEALMKTGRYAAGIISLKSGAGRMAPNTGRSTETGGDDAF